MELERAALLTGMCRMATKAHEASQALGKLGAAMKAVKWPVPNAVVKAAAEGSPATERSEP